MRAANASWQRSPTGAADRPAHGPDHHPSSNRPWNASAGNTGALNGAQQHHQGHQPYQGGGPFAPRPGASRRVPPRPIWHEPTARQAPEGAENVPRSRWLGALNTSVAPDSAASAAEDRHEVSASSDEEQGGSMRSAAPHRWVTAVHSGPPQGQYRDPRTWLPDRHQAAPAPPPQPRPPPYRPRQPKRDWTAFAPPKDNLVRSVPNPLAAQMGLTGCVLLFGGLVQTAGQVPGRGLTEVLENLRPHDK